MTKKEIQEIKRRLKAGEMEAQDVPEEISGDMEIVRLERKLGLRTVVEKGYDVISRAFFVDENIPFTDRNGMLHDETGNMTWFDDFESFYDFLDGDIYGNACYRFINLSEFDGFIKEKQIDVGRLLEKKCLSDQTVDTFGPEDAREKAAFLNGEKMLARLRPWEKKLEACENGADLENYFEKYRKSKLGIDGFAEYLFYSYAGKDIADSGRFKSVMEFVNTGQYPSHWVLKGLCFAYGPDRVLENYHPTLGSSTTIAKDKKRLKEFVELCRSGEIIRGRTGFFDSRIHKYAICEYGHFKGSDSHQGEFFRYYDTLDEFADAYGNDLSGVDLSGAYGLSVNTDRFKVDESTKLPFFSCRDYRIDVSKFYEKTADGDGQFSVCKKWYNSYGGLIKEITFSTPFFFDFVEFLNGDLSGADLIFCDGLENIESMEDVILDGALLTSSQCLKFGIPFKETVPDASSLMTFKETEKNEQESAKVPAPVDETAELTEQAEDDVFGEYHLQEISYISDIHLMHRIRNCRSENDIYKTVKELTASLAEDSHSILLIGGDISSSFVIFEHFLKAMRETGLCEYARIVFVLGNHEFWDFPGKTVEEITEIYRSLIESYGMYLLQNEIIYEEDEAFHYIREDEIQSMDTKSMREKLSAADLVLFGGTAFSGYNMEFNATKGIYRKTLDREGEIRETERFEKLYCKVLPAIADRNTVILTHTPKRDWSSENGYQKEFVYVSGHTHRNEFYDDGDYRIYADNQVGYFNDRIKLKSFSISMEYDCFSDYEDGIHEITAKQYCAFNRGKRIGGSYNRSGTIHMLKKNGYYCFIHESKNGSLCLLNGGALKRLDVQDVWHCYEHMDEVIAYIKGPLDKYTDIQKQIAEAVRSIGGTGIIHGCIVDIDFYDHIFVNPLDLKLTPYWALDMFEKVVYPDVPKLLKDKCPEQYEKYRKLLKGKSADILLPAKKKLNPGIMPKHYYSTDIYKVSREIKKMQKLNSNILSTWIEPSGGNRKLPS